MDYGLYTEKLTGLQFYGGTRIYFPTSYESIKVKNQWSGLTLIGGLRRSVGPFYFKYGATFTKYFNKSKARTTYSTVVRSSDVGVHPSTSIGDPYLLDSGFANTSFAITNTFVATYNITNNLNVSYSLLIWNTFAYKLKNAQVIDEFTSPNADAGRGRSDFLAPTLDLSYVLDDAISDWVSLPFSLVVSTGLTALHPAKTDNNKHIRWPVFWNSFGDSQAANNYGSFYLDLVGVY